MMDRSSTSRKSSPNKRASPPKSSSTSPSTRNMRRDEDEENLRAALAASMQTDYMAEILEAETRAMCDRVALSPPPISPSVTKAHSKGMQMVVDRLAQEINSKIDLQDELGDQIDASLLSNNQEQHQLLVKEGEEVNKGEEDEEEEEEEDPNLNNVFLNFAEHLMYDILMFLDEDSIGNCICSCKHMTIFARHDRIFEVLCRRIFPVQCPKVKVAAEADRFALRKFSSWFEMFHERPHVRYNGFYWKKFSYFKKPEYNMWSEGIVPGTVLQVIYYRYFAFQRDGTVLYGMLFKPPHDAGQILRAKKKEVYRGQYQVEKNQLFVSVPTNHCVVEFRFRISDNLHHGHGRGGAKNVLLVLDEHYSFSEPDRTGWVDYYDTYEEEFQFYREWRL